MKEGFAPIYFEAPVGEKNLLEEYCKIHHLQKTDVLRSFIRSLRIEQGDQPAARKTVDPWAEFDESFDEEFDDDLIDIPAAKVLKQVAEHRKKWNRAISKEEIDPWLRSIAAEAQQELADAESLRSMAAQLLTIAERLEK